MSFRIWRICFPGGQSGLFDDVDAAAFAHITMFLGTQGSGIGADRFIFTLAFPRQRFGLTSSKVVMRVCGLAGRLVFASKTGRDLLPAHCVQEIPFFLLNTRIAFGKRRFEY